MMGDDWEGGGFGKLEREDLTGLSTAWEWQIAEAAAVG